MTVFKDISNNEYVADTEIKLTEGVNGEKSLTGTIYFGNDVKKNLAKGWTMVFNNEEYAIVTFRYNDTDNTVSFSAVQMFFYTLSVKVFHEKWNGSHPLNEYLNAIFKDTGYSYINETSASAFEKENWGLKDKLTLFNDIINQISAEFEVKGKTVYIKDKIGSDLSTVVRQGFNLSTAEIETDSSSFATYGIGYGVHDDVDDQTSPRLSVEYYSPLYDMYKEKFGAIEAEPVDDERYTISDNLLAAVKKKVDNSWSLSITVSLLDLQNAGYPYAMASAGDSITIVDESLGFEDEVRIIKVVSSYNINGERISVDVTCGDLTMAQAQSASSSVATSTITDIINGNSVLPDAWFSEQMQLATNSILAARTELKFTDQGIIAIDTTDHNKMVILNSAGIGVSTDGGQTFKTAITADSIDGQNINIKDINASNITTGTISGANLNIDLKTGQVIFQKGRIHSASNNIDINVDQGYVSVANDKARVMLKDGGIQFVQPNFFDTSTNPYLSISNGGSGLAYSGARIVGRDYVVLSNSANARNIFDESFGAETFAGISMGYDGSDWHPTKIGGADRGIILSAGEPLNKVSSVGAPASIKIGIKKHGSWGGNRIMLTGEYVHILSTYTQTSSKSANVIVSQDGALVRSTSASKYKTDIKRTMDDNYGQKLLDLPTATWLDKADMKRYSDDPVKQPEPTRNFGMIAEDLAAAGLEYLVVRGVDGQLEGIEYDRIGPALIPVIAKLQKRIEILEQAKEKFNHENG